MDVISSFEIPKDSNLVSPLGMVTREPLLNDFVVYLTAILGQIKTHPDANHEINFSRQKLREIRRAFSAMILRGERALHQLSELLCDHYFAAYQLSTVVVGEIDTTKERFVLSQGLSSKDLYSTSDLDLGTRQLAKLRFTDGVKWSPATLVANFVEYQPTEPNAMKIQKIISRIKAEEEIWNKVVDEIFDLDGMVRRDKQMSHLSQFVKDVFGIKIVVDSTADVLPLHQSLFAANWNAAQLERIGIEPRDDRLHLEPLETKNYLAQDSRKASGWAAMKSVVQWGGRTFEIQVQPLRNYYNEQEYLTKESHAGFKSKRETLRNDIAAKIPLFGFYQALLKWLFLAEAEPGQAPTYPGVRIVLSE
ncbi:MAG: hypothetical protein RL011_411 [Pseudomonadota bacterium]|jgi:hypothetical protein